MLPDPESFAARLHEYVASHMEFFSVHTLSNIVKAAPARGEASLEVLLALRRLQEQNEQLQQENERLRAKSTDADPMVEAEAPTAEQAKLVVAAAEIARADVGMSC